ncbi:MFS transporter [Novosphingobium sp. KA1]|uniref:spinster family MFS transporter n=1 Tax=Novosphingobium sp. (strain KA1) TaxID=164608 RepID=UPI001A8C6888|nr:MFS transporter [Novosphingobium sp. KA1]QSR20164.1 MFS transporter [Novosphingobium sp. KA1]
MTNANAPATPRYGWYVTAVLMVAYTFSFLDRQILNLMVGPIKADLAITDTQFAMLTGGAFGIFYTVMALPIGWLADRVSRKKLIAGGIALWSLMTMLCGTARTFPALLFTRIGVGVGEATLSPSAYSMLSDSFDRSRLPRAMSLYAIGIYIGAGTAMMLGGSIVEAIHRTPDVVLPILGATRSWHLVFLVVGAPGLLVSLWMLTLREPARRHSASEEQHSSNRSAPAAIWALLRRYPLMATSLFLGSAVLSVLSSMDAWYPELFIRKLGWDAAQTGHVNGVTSLTAGPLGMLAAGWLSSRMIARGRSDACLRLTAWSAALATVPAIVMPLLPNGFAMGLMLLPLKFLGGFTPVLIPAAIQIVAPDRLRGQLGALFLFTTGVVGVTLGPVLPALINDFVLHDEHALGLSLSVSALAVGPLAVLLLSIGLKEYRSRLAQVSGDDAPRASAVSGTADASLPLAQTI